MALEQFVDPSGLAAQDVHTQFEVPRPQLQSHCGVEALSLTAVQETAAGQPSKQFVGLY